MTSVLTAKGETFEVPGSRFCDIANWSYDDQTKQGAALTKRHDTTRGLRVSSGEKVISVCRCIDLGVSPLSVGHRDKRRGPPCRQFATRPWSIKLWTGRFICLDRAILEHSHTLTQSSVWNFAAHISDWNPFDNTKMFVAVCHKLTQLVTYWVTYREYLLKFRS